MPTVNVYSQEGNVTGTLELNPAHFGVKAKSSFIHEIAIAQQANRRRAIANTKTKGEVRGGGKKPWKQKGTGRARQGSIRSPQWVGGGIVFGPTKLRNFSVKVNRKVKQKALFMAISDRAKNDQLLVLEGFVPTTPKTKEAATLFAKLPVRRNALVVLPKSDPMLLRMVRNLPHVKLITVNSLNLVDVLAYPTLIFWKDAVPMFEAIYKN